MVSELVGMRCDFTQAVAGLVLEGFRQGKLVALNECKRSNEQAIINAAGSGGRAQIMNVLQMAGWKDLALAIGDNGAANGIRNSLHEVGLAVDLLLYDAMGKYLTSGMEYERLGVWWENNDSRAAWGGRFGDPGHFSFKWQGKK